MALGAIGRFGKGFFAGSKASAQGFWKAWDKVSGFTDSKFANWWTKAPSGSVKPGPYIPGKAPTQELSAIGKAFGPAIRHPVATRRAAIAGAGVYGYASGEGSFTDKLTRGATFAVGMGLGTSQTFRAGVMKQANVGARAMSRHGFKKGGLAMLNRAFPAGGMTGAMRGAMVGAAYGAVDDDTSVLGGALMGAGLGHIGPRLSQHIRQFPKNPPGPYKPRFRNASYVKMGGGFGAIAGAVVGGPAGMAVGAGIGGAGGGLARLSSKLGPNGMRNLGYATIFTAGSSMVLAGSAAQAYAMHQNPRDTNLGASGDLALGLHSLRHG